MIVIPLPYVEFHTAWCILYTVLCFVKVSLWCSVLHPCHKYSELYSMKKMLKTRPQSCYCNSFLLCANLHLNPLIYKLCIWNFNNLSATNSLHELLVINAVHMNSDGNNRGKWWMMGSEAAYQYVPRRNRSTLHTGTRSRNSSRAVPPSWCNADPPAPSRTQNSKSASYASDGPLPRCTHLQR